SEAVMTKQYVCAAGSFRCTRISAIGNRRAPQPAAYLVIRQNQTGGDWNETASATARIAKIPILILTSVKAAAMDPAAVSASQMYRGFFAGIPLPARQTSNSMHSSWGWPGSLVKNDKTR